MMLAWRQPSALGAMTGHFAAIFDHLVDACRRAGQVTVTRAEGGW
jgi:hypothetical protein